MDLYYEIDKNFTIKVWNLDETNENDAPFLLQPSWPNRTPWANSEEAKAWAELFVDSLENPDSEFIPGNSPEEPKVLRPERETEKPEVKSKK